ncbi:uncharacterized protein VTP21DRAFT_1997 [Calcarisporiella thermophila]|uniref:uncharacterized protein n=1 Tax=Calcarisporiella thermophila TaxID=911321 RepID=UPI0037444588
MSLGRTFKLNTGYTIPAVGLGTWLSKPHEVQHAVETALEVGYRHIDCAHAYQNEKEVGAALKNMAKKVPREQIFITSKLWNTDHHPDRVQKALEKTLANLGVEYLDLYLMHWPVSFKPGDDPFPKGPDGKMIIDDTDYCDTWAAMEKLLATGKVRSIGVSNFNVENLERLIKSAKVVPAVNQIEMQPYLVQEDLLRFCNQHNIHVTAYSPLGNNVRKIKRVIDDEVVKQIAKKNGRTPAQILISWAVQREVSVLAKSVTPERIKSNFEDMILSEADMQELAKLASRNIRYCVPLGEDWPVVIFGDDKEQLKKQESFKEE